MLTYDYYLTDILGKKHETKSHLKIKKTIINKNDALNAELVNTLVTCEGIRKETYRDIYPLLSYILKYKQCGWPGDFEPYIDLDSPRFLLELAALTN